MQNIVITPITNDDVTEDLPAKSYIRVHKIFVLERRLIKGKVSSLKTAKYQELIKRINKIIEYGISRLLQLRGRIPCLYFQLQVLNRTLFNLTL